MESRLAYDQLYAGAGLSDLLAKPWTRFCNQISDAPGSGAPGRTRTSDTGFRKPLNNCS